MSETARPATDASSSPTADSLIRISADVVFHRDVLRLAVPPSGAAAEKSTGRTTAQLALDLDEEC
jgi:hypothetical protein